MTASGLFSGGSAHDPGRFHVHGDSARGGERVPLAGRTYRGEDTSGPVWTPRPARRNSAARNETPGRSRRCRRLGVAQFTGYDEVPRAQLGARPPATPTSATAVFWSRFAASSAPARRARSRPAPMITSAPPTAKASTRSAVRTLRSAVGFSVHEAPQGRDREHEPVQVVVDVEVAGKAGSREPWLVPRAVRALGRDR